MTRQAFIHKIMRMGLGLPFMSTFLLEACSEEGISPPALETDFSGKVLIVGAGAAGLAAAYALNRYGVDFQVIEAAPVYGGRLKRAEGFADFPIDIGAEWMHTDPSVLSRIISNSDINAELDIIVYNPQTIQTWNNGKLRSHNYISSLYSEWKFKNDTWYGFFEKHIVPEILDKIVLGSPITEIDYSADKVVLKTSDGRAYQGDTVLVTVPIKILQNESIRFVPALPAAKSEAINSVYMGDGIKIFVEFKERFYPDLVGFGNIFKALSAEEKYVYDAAFRKDSGQHILGLFAINDQAAAYTSLGSEAEIIAHYLAELDEIFEGKASANYLQHIIQNWSAEPYIQGAYSYEFDGRQRKIVEAIAEPLNNRLHFAGEALSIDHQATVHGACESAFAAVEKLLKA